MVAEDRYCIDILNQINAVRRALEKVALKIMSSHMESCVSEVMRSDAQTLEIAVEVLVGFMESCVREVMRSDGERKKIKELMDTIDQFVR